MNFWKPVAIVSSSGLAILLACGGGEVVVRPAGADQPRMEAAREHLQHARGELDRGHRDLLTSTPDAEQLVGHTSRSRAHRLRGQPIRGRQ